MTVLREFRCSACSYTIECFTAETHALIQCARCAVANYHVIMSRVITAPAIRGATCAKT